jgi:hypothetical protein
MLLKRLTLERLTALSAGVARSGWPPAGEGGSENDNATANSATMHHASRERSPRFKGGAAMIKTSGTGGTQD